MGKNFRYKFIPSKKDPETCTFCGGGKQLKTTDRAQLLHTDTDKHPLFK